MLFQGCYLSYYNKVNLRRLRDIFKYFIERDENVCETKINNIVRLAVRLHNNFFYYGLNVSTLTGHLRVAFFLKKSF